MHTIRTTTLLLVLLGAGCTTHHNELADRRAGWERAREELDAAPAVLEEDADLAALLAFARAHNPAIEAAFHRWREALERVPQSSTLPEPRITFGAYLSEIETRTGPMQGRVGISQMLPWFGKRELAGDAAFERAEAARERLEAARLELDQRVRDAWYEAAWIEEAIAITEGNRELLSHWESVARARLETGLGPHRDVIRAQVELGKLEDRVRTLVDLRRPVRARLNEALGRAPDAALPPAASARGDAPPPEARELLDALTETSPLLRALDHEVAAAELSRELAGKAYWPDLVVGADYTLIGSARGTGVSGSGDDALAVTLGLDLPLWRGTYRAGERAAEAGSIAARRERDAQHDRLRTELELELYRARDAHRRIALFQGTLVPKGEEALRAVDTAYQAGDEGFLELIDAERVLLEFQLETARARADRAQALAKVARIAGTDIDPER